MEDRKVCGEGIGGVLGPNVGKDLEDGMDAGNGMRVRVERGGRHLPCLYGIRSLVMGKRPLVS